MNITAHQKLEERLGQYDGNLCDARIWKEKPKSGGLGYDNIQCSSKKVDGCDCLCKHHFKKKSEGKLWTGLITEPRPEEVVDLALQRRGLPADKKWSTDKDGNDIDIVKKQKKYAKDMSIVEHMSIAELQHFVEEVKKKEAEDKAKKEELLVLLAKAKKKEAEEKKEKKKKELFSLFAEAKKKAEEYVSLFDLELGERVAADDFHAKLWRAKELTICVDFNDDYTPLPVSHFVEHLEADTEKVEFDDEEDE